MQLSKINIHLSVLFVLLGCSLLSQNDAKNIYYGNQLYFSGKHPESIDYYRQALKANPNNQKANFNLGSSLYKSALQIRESKENFVQGGKKVTPDSLASLVFEEAAQNFAQVANTISDKDTLHRAWHNVGNCYLQKKEYQQAVDAYKKSLKYNPKDEETRYNLAYALKRLPKDKKGGGGSKQQQNQKENKNEKNKDQAPKPAEMNKDQAEQLLQALMNSEKKLQDKRKQKQDDAGKPPVEKDW